MHIHNSQIPSSYSQSRSFFLALALFSAIIILFVFYEENLKTTTTTTTPFYFGKDKNLQDHEITVLLHALHEKNASRFFNQLGSSRIPISDFENSWRMVPNETNMKDESVKWRSNLHQTLVKIGRGIKEKSQHFPNVNRQHPSRMSRNFKRNITMATVGCGTSLTDAMILIKSATLFSQDANLHVILFTDGPTIQNAGKALMELKWTVNELGWDFSFEIQQNWFPKENHDMWAKIWKPCSSQRLFFPSRLPHIDSLIYLDADTIIVANLTKLWSEFEKMNDGQLGGLVANTEYPALGWYNTKTRVPHYGHGALNAGVMLMNLTRMREWGFQEKAMKAYADYEKDIELADQDILNIMFNKTPEKVAELSCVYNFCGSHCFTEGIKGFCQDLKTEGMKIAHGNAGDFKNNRLPFYFQFFHTFEKFDLLAHSYQQLLTNLTNSFNSLLDQEPPPCLILEPEDMYKNGAEFLSKVSSNNFTLEFKKLPKNKR